MKKSLTALFIAIAAAILPAVAQNSIGTVLALLRGKDAVSCSYFYKMRGNMPMEGSGTAVLCGHKYYAVAGDLVTYCDGATVWMVDSSAKEVYIEKAGGSIVSNIEKYLGAVKDFKYDGSSLSCKLLKKDQGLDLDFRADDIKVIPLESDDTSYSFDVSALDSSWVVTDMR